MRVETKNNSFLNKVRKFLPERKERRKKAHISTKEQEKFLDTEKRELEELLSYAKHKQKKCEEEKKNLYSEIRRLRKPVKYTTLGIREMMFCKRIIRLARVKREANSLKNTIKKLEAAEKKMIDDPQEFLRKKGML